MGMRFTPKGYGGNRRDPDQVKRDGWHEQHMLAVSLDDHRLTWPERELVRQLGEKLYGKLPAVQGGAPWPMNGHGQWWPTGWI